MFKNYKVIKNNRNGRVASLIIYLLYLEVKYKLGLLKLFRQFIWQPTLGVQLPPRAFDVEAVLTLRLVHPYLIIINGGSKIGKNCTFYHDVTIGAIETKNSLSPIIGNNVYIGCKSSVLGGITVGDSTKIGAHSLVLGDTPPRVGYNWLIQRRLIEDKYLHITHKRNM